MAADRFHVPVDAKYQATGWDRGTARRGYELACRLVLEFLNETVNGEAAAKVRLDALMRREGRLDVERLAPLPTAPAPDEVPALAAASGLDGVKEQFRAACQDRAPAACVDAGQFNSYGYDLLGQKRGRDAIAVFEIVAWAHPTLANAQDSLADGYLAAGDTEKARAALRTAIELAPADPAMDAAARARFVAEERSRLEHLR